jgi:hypothetical protein
VLPLAVESAEKAVLSLYSNVFPFAVNTVLETPEPQVNTPEAIPQDPFDDFNVNPPPVLVAVIVAQVPLVYHVPSEMRQPFCEPLAMTFRNPDPLNAPPGAEVGLLPGAELTLVGVLPLPLGRYLMPALGQFDRVRLSVGTNCPL